MGVLLGALFLWKDSILHQLEQGDKSKRWYRNLPTMRRLSNQPNHKAPDTDRMTPVQQNAIVHDGAQILNNQLMNSGFALELVTGPLDTEGFSSSSTNSTTTPVEDGATDTDSDTEGIRV
jgi:hypothetical protein